MIPIAAIVLTRNEEQNLAECLKPLAHRVQDLFVVDSGSTDGTIGIAKAAGATVVSHPFESHSKQWNWALQNLNLNSDWILGIDADQRITPELLESVERFISSNPESNGAYVARRQIFLGRWIRHGAYYPKYLLKLFKKGFAGADENDLVDHHFRVEGPVVVLKGDLIEDNLKERDLSFWMQKHVRYSVLQAEQESRSDGRWEGKLAGNPDQRVQWLKSLWIRLPLFFRPFLYFSYRYVFRLGFLDGIEGLIFHAFQAFWYRFLVDLRLSELRNTAHHDLAGRTIAHPLL